VGGGLLINLCFVEWLGVWVLFEDVLDVWVVVMFVFCDYGYCCLWYKVWLKFLFVDWGVLWFCEVVEEYFGCFLVDGLVVLLFVDFGDYVGVYV